MLLAPSCAVLKYIKAEAGATEATPQQVGGHARAMLFADLAAVEAPQNLVDSIIGCRHATHTQFSPLFSPRNTHAGWKVSRPYNTSMRW